MQCLTLKAIMLLTERATVVDSALPHVIFSSLCNYWFERLSIRDSIGLNTTYDFVAIFEERIHLLQLELAEGKEVCQSKVFDGQA